MSYRPVALRGSDHADRAVASMLCNPPRAGRVPRFGGDPSVFALFTNGSEVVARESRRRAGHQATARHCCSISVAEVR